MADSDVVDMLHAWGLSSYIDVFKGTFSCFYLMQHLAFYIHFMTQNRLDDIYLGIYSSCGLYK